MNEDSHNIYIYIYYDLKQDLKMYTCKYMYKF